MEWRAGGNGLIKEFFHYSYTIHEEDSNEGIKYLIKIVNDHDKDYVLFEKECYAKERSDVGNFVYGIIEFISQEDRFKSYLKDSCNDYLKLIGSLKTECLENPCFTKEELRLLFISLDAICFNHKHTLSVIDLKNKVQSMIENYKDE